MENRLSLPLMLNLSVTFAHNIEYSSLLFDLRLRSTLSLSIAFATNFSNFLAFQAIENGSGWGKFPAHENLSRSLFLLRPSSPCRIWGADWICPQLTLLVWGLLISCHFRWMEVFIDHWLGNFTPVHLEESPNIVAKTEFCLFCGLSMWSPMTNVNYLSYWSIETGNVLKVNYCVSFCLYFCLLIALILL